MYDGLNSIAVKRKDGGTSEYVYGPTGLIAANINGTWYFVLKDHLGSARTIVDQSGSSKAAIDYAPYGAIIRTSGSPNIAYQFTGQEYDSTSGLWNYKARMYDAELGVFYAVDPAGQFGSAYIYNNDEYAQNNVTSQKDSVEINEMASPFLYTGNNPVRYVDRNGELFIIDDYAIGFVKGLAKGKNPFKTGWKHAQNSALIWGGLFQGSPTQILSRFTWELPQTVVGFTGAHGTNMFGNVKSVKYYDGATVIRTGSKGYWGITLGSYIIGSREMKVGIGTSLGHQLFMHEYGHYLQSQRNGPLYLTKYGIPSLANAAFGSNHNKYWTETDANRRAERYFRVQHGFTQWNDSYYPRASQLSNGSWWEYPLWPISFFWNF
ncbi:MAG TPA: RHS repeat-associated core domain-containing protein [bacterium]|nr:RHS repeat-associated core domain-containing protein [bacterium]HMY37258.1 RHS repeat-associated core domain-containing protein [bacterium]HNB58153.1 RHS repeat-associated core domain-containing protein [bacterium]HNH33691.1 RHS repeat-associated core domain-containing protein [bacterium]HNO91928.1 RHS repeat-associated core domain-containing protein [bacterium]